MKRELKKVVNFVWRLRMFIAAFITLCYLFHCKFPLERKPTIFIGVLTIPETFPKRSLIRMTYMTQKFNNIDIKFIFGTWS
jgi:hypothetical protein